MSVNIVKKELFLDDKKLLIIFGSPHDDGATSQLKDIVLAAFNNKSNISEIDCFKLNPAPCNDCRGCRKIRSCVFDDLDDYFEKLENADIILVATPIYTSSFPAPLKALLDRHQRYWSAKFIFNLNPPIEKPKDVILITVAGSDSNKDGLLVEEQLKSSLPLINGKLIKSFHHFGTDKNRDISEISNNIKEFLENNLK